MSHEELLGVINWMKEVICSCKAKYVLSYKLFNFADKLTLWK